MTNPQDYRDPKVTKDTGGGIGKWIAIAVAALLLLLLLGWLFGLLGDDEEVVVTDQPDAVVVTPEPEPDAVVVTPETDTDAVVVTE